MRIEAYLLAAARGPAYLEREQLSVYDAATSYFLSMMGSYTYRYKLCRLYMAESLTIIRSLGLHRTKEHGQIADMGRFSGPSGAPSDSNWDSMDLITQELGRRIFWTIFVGQR